jgi:hypothetical protein
MSRELRDVAERHCTTMLIGKVTSSSYAGRRVALKTYPAADTARFKCWGSGSRNEATARRRLGPIVPELVHWAFDDQAEFAWLEWIDGDPPTGTDEFYLAAGRTLGRIHTQPGPYWGSLDGVWQFPTCRDALRSRFAAGVDLLAIADAGLAAQVRDWAAAALDRLTVHRAPVLVHGDFGLGNLLLDHGIRVLDWEHARWGDVHEDWAKIRLAAVLPEPNHCGDARAVALVEHGWSEVVGRPPPRDPALERLLDAYLCCCLGVFFDGPDNAWLRRLRDLVGPNAAATRPRAVRPSQAPAPAAAGSRESE